MPRILGGCCGLLRMAEDVVRPENGEREETKGRACSAGWAPSTLSMKRDCPFPPQEAQGLLVLVPLPPPGTHASGAAQGCPEMPRPCRLQPAPYELLEPFLRNSKCHLPKPPRGAVAVANRPISHPHLPSQAWPCRVGLPSCLLLRVPNWTLAAAWA